MDYYLKPSLQERTVVKVAVMLWSRHDLRTLCLYDYEEWREMEAELIKKVENLPLPELLKRKVSCLIKPLGVRLLAWIRSCKNVINYCDPDRGGNEISKICWTCNGTINEYETVKLLIENENLDVFWRFSLSCIYCVEDHVNILWKQLDHKNFYKRLYQEQRGEKSLAFHTYFEYWLHPEVYNKMHIYFTSAIKNATNETSLKFFFRKASAEVRESILLDAAKQVVIIYCNNYGSPRGRESDTDILCFLLSSMNKEQKTKLFESNAYEVLSCFLVWPWQSFFIALAEELCPYLSKENYYYLLIAIANKIMEGFNDCDYRYHFHVLWRKSPPSYREYVIKECVDKSFLSRLLRISNSNNIKLICKDASVDEKNKIFFYGSNEYRVPKRDNLLVLRLSLLSRLFAIGDVNNLKLILRDASAEQREKILFNDEGKEICWSLIYSERWDLLKFFLQECISSEAVVIMFAHKFDKHLARFYSAELYANNKNYWIKFIQCFSLND